MKRFYDYLLELQESPAINSYHTKDRMTAAANDIRNQHQQKHIQGGTVHIGNGSYNYSDKDYHHYYHLDNGAVKSVNRITKNDNTQGFVDKGGESTEHVIRHMIHHILNHGELKTDSQQSPGAKHLWINFIKSKPENIKFEFNGKRLNHNNIDLHSDNIWNSSKNIVRAYANKT